MDEDISESPVDNDSKLVVKEQTIIDPVDEGRGNVEDEDSSIDGQDEISGDT